MIQPGARSRLASLAWLALASSTACWATGAAALPPGRAWTPITRLQAPGFGLTVAPRLEIDGAGIPELITLTRLPTDVLGYRWADSAWVQTWQLGRETITLWPVQSPPGTHYLVWNGLGPVAEEHLFFAEVLQSGVAEPETVAQVVGVRTEYSAAVSAVRRWVAVDDVVSGIQRVRVLISDTLGIWRDAPVENREFDITGGVAVATTGDSSALVAWAETFRLRWATLAGAQWNEGQTFYDGYVERLQFRRRPSGGQWLASAGIEPHALLRSYRNGTWTPPETLRCAYRDGLPFHSAESPDLSRDDGEYPVVVWDAQDSRALNTICVCVPTDSGYGVAEELEGVAGNGGLPTVARDRNGDVWVAWSWLGGDAWWIHSFVRATASTPRVEGAIGQRRITWTLSEPAPETWWAVLRSLGAGEFEQVARVRAGPTLDMSWTDSSALAGVLRYKIRRECVDVRYLWESAATRVPGMARRLVLSLSQPSPISHRGAVQIEGAVGGPLEFLLYDLQGRVVLQQRAVAGTSDHDIISFDLSGATQPLVSGVYFAAVRDASGATSPALKVVVLR